MKRVYLVIPLLIAIFLLSCREQQNEDETNLPPPDTTGLMQDPVLTPYHTVDISPMDMSYFPVDYPKLRMANQIQGPPLARVIYSRPHLQGRQLFPDILKFGEPWRLGANEATELQLFSDATIENRKIPAGRYVLFCIPQKDNWTIILNSNIDTWGLHRDSTKDIARFIVPVKQTNYNLEYFSIVFEPIEGGAELLMSWSNLEARLPLKFD